MYPSSLATRDIDALINTVRDVRIVSFKTPSCFYIQLLEDDAAYRQLEEELSDFYSIGSVLYYCEESFSISLDKSTSPLLERLKISELKVSELVRVKFHISIINFN